MVTITRNELQALNDLIKRLHPETKNGYYGRATIELDFQDSVVGNQPYIEIRCSHLVRVENKK